MPMKAGILPRLGLALVMSFMSAGGVTAEDNVAAGPSMNEPDNGLLDRAKDNFWASVEFTAVDKEQTQVLNASYFNNFFTRLIEVDEDDWKGGPVILGEEPVTVNYSCGSVGKVTQEIIDFIEGNTVLSFDTKKDNFLIKIKLRSYNFDVADDVISEVDGDFIEVGEGKGSFGIIRSELKRMMDRAVRSDVEYMKREIPGRLHSIPEARKNRAYSHRHQCNLS
jgi:hypothetical protein